MKFMMLLAMVGHIGCGVTDCLLTYTPGGKFSFADMKDSEVMRKKFTNMSLNRLVIAICAGVISLTVSAFGYLALAGWMKEYSQPASEAMYISAVLYFMSIVAHHVICGSVEWFYVRLNCRKEVLESVKDFFQATSVTMYIGYFALLVFAVVLLISIAAGITPLPKWMAFCNTLPIFILLARTKLPAKGNIAGALMCLGIAIVI